MNLKLKTTLLWLLTISVSIAVVALIFAIVWLLLAYPEIVFTIGMITFMLYVLIVTWLNIYHYLKTKNEKEI